MSIFSSLVQNHGLVGLNTWDSKLGPTYKHMDHGSRIDFGFTRFAWADGVARKPVYLWSCPLISANSCHVPMLFTLPKHWTSQRLNAQVRCGYQHRLQGRAAWSAQSETWQAFQHATHDRIDQFFASQPMCQDFAELHSSVLSDFCATFSPSKPVRLDPPGVSIIAEKWKHRQDSQRPRPVTPRNILRVWFHWSRFHHLDKQHRKHAISIRRQRIFDLTVEAQHAADCHDSFGLYQLIHRYSPKSPKRRIKLVNHQGCLATPLEEVAILKAYVQKVWDGPSNFLPSGGTAPGVPFTLPELIHELTSVQPNRSVAPGTMPNLVIKSVAHSLACHLYPMLESWWNTYPPHIPLGWRKGWITWLPKPSKNPNVPEHLRPICLQDSLGKGIIRLLTRKAQQQSHDAMCVWPQWAFMPGKGTQDALMRVVVHCKNTRTLTQSQRPSVHARANGAPKFLICGGIQLLLDLHRAFDAVDRSILFTGLESLGVSPSLQTLFRQWHSQTAYVITHQALEYDIPTGRGVRQGCCAAPFLFNTLTIIAMQRLASHLGFQWIRDFVTIFADDVHMGTTFTDPDTLERAIQAMGLLMDILEDLGLKLNPQKSVVLLTMVGPHAKRLYATHVLRKGKDCWLKVPRADHFCLIPIQEKAMYLGIRLSYRNIEDETLAVRLQSGYAASRRLQKWLSSRSGLHVKTKYQFLHSCVFTSIVYGLNIVGYTHTGIHKLLVALHRMLRFIIGDHAFVTGRTHEQALHRVGVPQPLSLLRTVAVRLQENHSHRCRKASLIDIVHHVDWSLLDQTIAFIDQIAVGPPPVMPASFSCPFCSHVATSLPNLRRHCTNTHSLSQHAIFPLDYLCMAVDGLPTCSSCHRTFTSWRQFRIHVSRPCTQVDSKRISARPLVHSCWRPGPMEPEGDLDPQLQFLQQHASGASIIGFVKAEDWVGLAQDREACALLAQSCIICGFHASRPQSLNSHYRQHHPRNFGEAFERGVRLTQQCTESPTCHYCEREFRSSHTCNVYTQVGVLQMLLTPPASSPRRDVRCSLCAESFPSAKLLAAHLRHHHRSSLGAHALDLDQAVDLPDSVRDHLQNGQLEELLSDVDYRHSLTHDCSFCGSTFTRPTDLVRHLHSVHVSAWTRSDDLALFLQASHPGCVCDPPPTQKRSSHQCPGFRQLAMQFLRLDAPLLVPFELDPQNLAACIHAHVDRSSLCLLQELLTSRDFEQLWTTEALQRLFSQQCLQCGRRFHPGELLHHLFEAHDVTNVGGLAGYIQQLVAVIAPLLHHCSHNSCLLCRQPFRLGLDTEDGSHLAQVHLRSQCGAVHQIALLLSICPHGRRSLSSECRGHEESSDGRGLQAYGISRHGCGSDRADKRRKVEETPPRASLSTERAPTGPEPGTEPTVDPGLSPRNVLGLRSPEATQPRQLCAVFREGRSRTPQGSDDSSLPMVSVQGGDTRAAPESHLDSALPGRALEESPGHCSSLGLKRASQECPVEQPSASGSLLAIPSLRCPNPDLGTDQGTSPAHADHVDPPPELGERVPDTIPDSPIPSPTEPTRSPEKSGGALETSASQQGGGGVSDDEAFGRQLGLALGVCQTEGAHPPLVRTGKGNSADLEGQWKGLTALDLRTRLAQIALPNPKNDCYLNSSFFAWIWTVSGLVDFRLEALGVHAASILTYLFSHQPGSLVTQPWFIEICDGWHAGGRQQDPAEILQCLLTESGTLFHMEWERRLLVFRQAAEKTEVDFHFQGAVPLELQFPDRMAKACTVQALLFHWQHERGMVQALLNFPTFLCLHVDRHRQLRDKGPITKIVAPLDISDPCIFPMFCPYSLGVDCTLEEYCPVAVVAHLGTTQGGHYRAALRYPGTTPSSWVITEDGLSATPCAELPLWVNEGATLIWYQRKSTMPVFNESNSEDSRSDAIMAALEHVNIAQPATN
eukprot:Skav231438  [mRNA]  locus=scaffold1847:209964:215732:- [translate_table: standard]